MHSKAQTPRVGRCISVRLRDVLYTIVILLTDRDDTRKHIVECSCPGIHIIAPAPP